MALARARMPILPAEQVQEWQELRQELRERDSAMLILQQQLQAELAASRQQVPHPCPLTGEEGGGVYTRGSTRFAPLALLHSGTRCAPLRAARCSACMR